jgi:thiol-disulfide isomerase/thioredoxin
VRPQQRRAPDRRSALVLLLLLFSGLSPAQTPVPELGHTLNRLETPVEAPAFTLHDMDGEAHALKDYRGKVVMINFWATWCPPCRREIPSMEAVYQSLADEGFVVLAVNEWETPDQVFPYIGQLDVFPSFPILFDRDGKLSEAYGIKGLPTTVLVDRQGRIVYRAIGGRDFNHPEVKGLIRELTR